MDQLIAGYHRFRHQKWPERRRMFHELSERGQSPRALIISCVDSRVDPGMIFDCAPGEVLVVRNVANLVPPYGPDMAYHGTSAALEFGIRVLNIPHIVVLGHGQCGGVRALLDGAPEHAQDFIAPWMEMAKGARTKTTDIPDPVLRQTCCEHEVVKTSLLNLMTFPWIRQRVHDHTLTLHGAWFAIESGTLQILQPNGQFEDIIDTTTNTKSAI